MVKRLPFIKKCYKPSKYKDLRGNPKGDQFFKMVTISRKKGAKMDEKAKQQYATVYQTMNAVLKYYKKYSTQPILDQDAAIKEANQMIVDSPVPSLMMDILFAVQNQIGREREGEKH